MKSHYKEDKDYLKDLCEVLEVSEVNLKRDDCNNCVLLGRRGIISTDTDNWYLYISTTPIKWKHIKQKLSWMDVTQDGDDEGILRSNLCMSKKQAEQIRKIAGLSLVHPLTPEEAALKREQFISRRKQGVSAPSMRLNEVPARVVACG